MGGVLTYYSNNSGGRWWLSTEDWKRLEAAGWTVHWIHDIDLDHGVDYGEEDNPHNRELSRLGGHSHQYGSREWKLVPVTFNENVDTWLGAYAKSASKRFDYAEDGVHDWENAAWQSAYDEGCNCCGEPHNFTWEDDDGQMRHSSLEVVQTRMNWW